MFILFLELGKENNLKPRKVNVKIIEIKCSYEEKYKQIWKKDKINVRLSGDQ